METNKQTSDCELTTNNELYMQHATMSDDTRKLFMVCGKLSDCWEDVYGVLERLYDSKAADREIEEFSTHTSAARDIILEKLIPMRISELWGVSCNESNPQL